MAFSLADKKRKLEEIVARDSRVAVACSGGVDSTLLLKVAHDVLGRENTIAVFADTGLLPPGEHEILAEAVGLIGSRLLTVKPDPLSWPEFVENPRERCYLCKKKIYLAFLQELAAMDFPVLADGTNLDDLDEFRPGLRALDELGIRKPLAEAGLGKKEIRELSRELGLPNWNSYSSSCLATRIATGQSISKEKLDLVKKCENLLHRNSFFGCRVRISDVTAVIELQKGDIHRFQQVELLIKISEKLNNIGIKKVFLDPEGRESGLLEEK